MAIKQQKRQKPSAYAKTSDSPSLTWNGKKGSTPNTSLKSSPLTTEGVPTAASFLAKDLSKSAFAAVCGVFFLVAVWMLIA